MNKLILVVEDEADLRFLAVCVLRAAGARVVEARDGKEGLDLGLALKPDLILMDVSMPTMDGITATEALRKSGYLELIVAYTAADFDMNDTALTGAYFDAKILKPCSNEALVERLTQQLESDSARRQPARRKVLNGHAHHDGIVLLYRKRK